MKNTTTIPPADVLREHMLRNATAVDQPPSPHISTLNAVKMTLPLTREEREAAALLTESKEPQDVLQPRYLNAPASISMEGLESFELIPLDLIDPPPIFQRQVYTPAMVDKMAQAIRRNGNGDAIKGQITPIVLIPNVDKPGRYITVDGYTRFLAFSTHFLAPKIKASIRNDLDKQSCFQVAFAANEERNSASDYDKGMALAKALAEGYYTDQEHIALKLGISVSTVSNLLSFASFPKEVIEVIEQDPTRFSYNFAAKLLTLLKKSDAEQTATVAKKVLTGTMPYSKLQKFVSEFKGNNNKATRKPRNSRAILTYGKVKSTDSAVTVTLESLPTNISQGLADHLEKAAIEYLKSNIASESETSGSRDE